MRAKGSMPASVQVVSNRNGSQIMVAGLRLRELGYRRGAYVQVTDPSADPAHEPWCFIVSNNEHATLVCRQPRPPLWIQPGVRVRIDVRPPERDSDEESASTLDNASARRTPESAAEVGTEEVVLPQPRYGLPARVIYAVDVGAPGSGLAWARIAPVSEVRPSGSTDFGLFLDQIAQDMRASLPVALGFEAPLFLPVAAVVADLTRARRGEPGPWSFGAGAYVTTVAIPLMALTLQHIRTSLPVAPAVTLDPSRWLAPDPSAPNLLLWEAYIWGSAHSRARNEADLRADVQDAATALRAFIEWERAESRQPSEVTAHDPISTAGAAVLWAGLDDDIALLHRQTLVLRPTRPMGADVMPFVTGSTRTRRRTTRCTRGRS